MSATNLPSVTMRYIKKGTFAPLDSLQDDHIPSGHRGDGDAVPIGTREHGSVRPVSRAHSMTYHAHYRDNADQACHSSEKGNQKVPVLRRHAECIPHSKGPCKSAARSFKTRIPMEMTRSHGFCSYSSSLLVVLQSIHLAAPHLSPLHHLT